MNTMKKITLVLVIGILMIAASAVAAQQGQSGQGQGPHGQNGQNQANNAPINFELSARVIAAAGLDPAAAQQQLQAGVQLIDILSANNVDMDVLRTNLMTDISALYSNAVASGRMPPERAAERTAHVIARLERMGVCLTSA